jgi:membrane-bound lytic murein transglycosylase D
LLAAGLWSTLALSACSGPRLTGSGNRLDGGQGSAACTAVMVLPMLQGGSDAILTPPSASLPPDLVGRSDIAYRADRFPGRADIKGLVERILLNEGVPREIGALAWIESDFSVGCYSSAGAAGPWQMMRDTGRDMGLRIDDMVDERYSWVASTRAAARYLRDLHDLFDDWSLAIAGYNCGPGRVLSGMGSGTCTFGNVDLPSETDLFVPRFASAAEAYMQVEMETEDLAVVWVPAGLDLRVLAVECGMDVDSLMAINRSYLLERTPPDRAAWEVVVPASSASMVLDTAWSMTPDRYLVQTGDSWSGLASEFGVQQDALVQANPGVVLEPGSTVELPSSQRSPVNAGVADNPQFFRYTVRAGDTLGGIGEGVGVSSREVASWNDLSAGALIYPGDVLLLRHPEETQGDQEAAEAPTLPATDEIDIVTGGVRVLHTVAAGDTLWDMALRYGVSVEQIRYLNSLEGNNLSIGAVLVIMPD